MNKRVVIFGRTKSMVIWTVVLLTAVFFLTSASRAFAQEDTTKIIDRDKLINITRSEGLASVLVTLNVPGYEELAAKSSSFKAGPADGRVSQEALKADEAIARKVSAVADKVLSSLANTEYFINHTYSFLPLLALDVTEKTLEALESSPDTARIYEDRLVRLPETPDEKQENPTNDADEVSRIWKTLKENVELIGADQEWSLGYTGKGWCVAILDTGVLTSHEFFQGKDIVEACFSANGTCPNGETEMFGPGSAALFEAEIQGYDHGTHVAGIAAGYNNNELYGVAIGSDIIAVKVFSRFTPEECAKYGYDDEPCTLSYSSDQIAGLEYVYSLRNQLAIASVNMSLGGGWYDDEQVCDEDAEMEKTAIDNLRAAGIATVIASGNSEYCTGISAPACISSAVSVGASDVNTQSTFFSNYHHELLDVYAPGYKIYSSIGESDTSYGYKSGTSMAAPFVAGAWAVVKHRYPAASVSEVLDLLTENGVPIDPRCFANDVWKPRIQLAGIGVIGPDSGMTSALPTFRWREVEGAETYRVQVLDGNGAVAAEKWFNPSAITVNGICGARFKYSLEDGEYSWWVASGKSTIRTKISGEQYFRVNMRSLPDQPVASFPDGIVTDNYPFFGWRPGDGTRENQLAVWQKGGGKVFEAWYETSDNAKGSYCLAFPDKKFPVGEYVWKVRGSNLQGDGPWSDGMEFTIVEPPLSGEE